MVKREKIILISFFSLLLALGSLNVFLTYKGKIGNVVTPKGDTFSVLSASTSFVPPELPNYVVYGYLPYWTLNAVEYLQLDKLTDIAYFGLNINAKGEIVKTGEDGNLLPGYRNWRESEKLDALVELTELYGTRLALTIVAHEDAVSTAFLKCPECWDTFYNELTTEMDFRGVRHVNLNFEYVQYVEKDIALLHTQFVDYLNKRLDERYGNSFLVSSAFADSVVKDRVGDIPSLAQAADGIFIMAYDFHSAGSQSTGPVSPVGGGEGVLQDYDINTLIKDYLSVAPPSKLILGLPYYGYNWVVEQHAPYTAVLIDDTDDLVSHSQTYASIIETLITTGAEVKWDEVSRVPFFSYESPETGALRQVYFENTESLKEKYQIVKSNQLMGAGIWALGYDGGYQELWDLLGEEF